MVPRLFYQWFHLWIIVRTKNGIRPKWILVLKKDYHPINHLICLGTGNLRNRHVIHLFSDENGGIQPYAVVKNPYCNEHYILDE